MSDIKKDTGLVGSVKEALSYGENTFMFYTGAPQNTIRSTINLKQVEEAFALMKEKGVWLLTKLLFMHPI